MSVQCDMMNLLLLLFDSLLLLLLDRFPYETIVQTA